MLTCTENFARLVICRFLLLNQDIRVFLIYIVRKVLEAQLIIDCLLDFIVYHIAHGGPSLAKVR